jgi:hypothetical protein
VGCPLTCCGETGALRTDSAKHKFESMCRKYSPGGTQDKRKGNAFSSIPLVPARSVFR